MTQGSWIVLSRKTFYLLFGVHTPKWAVEAYAGGVKYKLVNSRMAEVVELERLLLLEANSPRLSLEDQTQK
jgi:hypothetical protein